MGPYLVRALLPRERLDILLILSKHHPSCFRDCPFLSPWNFTISGTSQAFRVSIYLHSPFCRLCERLSETFRTHQRTLFQDAPLPRAVTIPIVFLDDLDPLAYTETINHLEDACEINSDY